MSGGELERVAAYVNNGNSNLIIYGSSLVSADSKYKDVYNKGSNDDYATNYNANSDRVGDAVYETSSSCSDATSWYNNNSYMPYSDVPFFVRGGYCDDSWRAGLFYFSHTYGNGAGGVCFRPVVAVGDTL